MNPYGKQGAARQFPAISSLALATASLFCVSPAQAAAQTQEVLVTATRKATPASDLLIDHQVIHQAEIQASGVNSLSEFLQKKRGFELSSNGGPANYSSVFMRGTANAQSIVLVDGVRIGSASNGGATWQAIPLSQIERIEIVYGPLSSLYGADAMGGVVQIFTKQGSKFLEPQVGVSVGNRGLRKYELGLSGSTGGERGVRYALNAVHEEETGQNATNRKNKFSFDPDEDGYARDSFSAQLGWKWAKDHELGTSLLRSRQNSQFDSGAGYDDRDVTSLETWSVYSRDKFAPNWQSMLRFSIANDRGFSDASYGLSRYETTQTQYSWQNDIEFGPDNLQLTLEHRKEELGSSSKSLERNRKTTSFAGAWQVKRDVWLATASMRHDRISTNGNQTTGALAAGYKFSPGWQATASYGMSFRAPTFNELYYPGFGLEGNQAEKGRNLEFGLQYQAGASRLQAALFRNKIDNLIVYAPVCPVEKATHPYGCAYNLNRAVITGLSIGGSMPLAGAFTLRGNYDWQDAKDDSSGKRLPRRAKQHGSLGLDWAAEGWKAGVETVFADRRYDDVANNTPLAGYGVWNLYAARQIARGWEVQARWNNVANKAYELANGFNASPSRFVLSLRYDQF
ncbi:TonB-dependent receptor [Massilia sp. W12]|uniref:TonB-dependent receptor domain-containing protein n=1 Tax=Massilia sp. W12 TaxID=3126507 RepID=UPI0030CF5BD7